MDFDFGVVLEKEIQTPLKNCNIYNINEIMAQTQKYLSFPQVNKKEHCLKP